MNDFYCPKVKQYAPMIRYIADRVFPARCRKKDCIFKNKCKYSLKNPPEPERKLEGLE